MSDEELNRELMRAVGWYVIEDEETGCFSLREPVKITLYGWHKTEAEAYLDGPDYCTDLNACHEVEKGLTHEQWAKFRQVLFPIAAGNDAGDFERNLLPKLPAGFTRGRAYHCASARHRALALLKTLSS